jgi:hypothetical protein
LFEIGGVFALGLVHLIQNPHRHAQAGRSLHTVVCVKPSAWALRTPAPPCGDGALATLATP